MSLAERALRNYGTLIKSRPEVLRMQRVVGAAIVGLWLAASSTSSSAQTAKEGTKAPELSKERKLSLCVESWDATTHMSKQEWRTARLRSIKDYPDAFER
jgi:hypothetical protein